MALSTNTATTASTSSVTLSSSNSSTCPEGQSPDENGNCVTDLMVGQVYTPGPTDMGGGWMHNDPTDSTCEEQGKVKCYTGDCADSLEECTDNYDIGYDPEGKFITDDPETTYDDALYDVYLAINDGDDASGWTKLSFKDWAEKYGDSFPQWEGSQYERQSELLESQLGLLGDQLALKEESFEFQRDLNRYQTTSKLEDQKFAYEAMIRAGGGDLESGQRKEKVQTAYDRVLEGFDYDQSAIDLERENSLLDFEGRALKGEFDLSKVVSDFQDNMWDLISTNKELQEGEDISGCTDSNALNYNSNANIEDGSCTYLEDGTTLEQEVIGIEEHVATCQAQHGENADNVQACIGTHAEGTIWLDEFFTSPTETEYDDMADLGGLDEDEAGDILELGNEAAQGEGLLHDLCCANAKTVSLGKCLGKWGSEYTNCRNNHHNATCGGC